MRRGPEGWAAGCCFNRHQSRTGSLLAGYQGYKNCVPEMRYRDRKCEAAVQDWNSLSSVLPPRIARACMLASTIEEPRCNKKEDNRIIGVDIADIDGKHVI